MMRVRIYEFVWARSVVKWKNFKEALSHSAKSFSSPAKLWLPLKCDDDDDEAMVLK